jgi:hypothetical protein
VRPGVKIGANFGGVIGDKHAEQYGEHGNPKNFRLMPGFQVGMIADCPITDAFAIQPGARFAMQGFKDDYHSGGAGGTRWVRSFSLFYVQVPVNVQYRLNIAEDANLLFQAGPYAGFGIFGRQTANRRGENADLTDEQKKITFGENNDINKSFDIGVGAGIGFEFHRFQIMANYDFGLVNSHFNKQAMSALYDVNLRNHNFSVTLAVIFGRRDPLMHLRDY